MILTKDDICWSHLQGLFTYQTYVIFLGSMAVVGQRDCQLFTVAASKILN